LDEFNKLKIGDHTLKQATANTGNYKRGDLIQDSIYNKLPNFLKTNFRPYVFPRGKITAAINQINKTNITNKRGTK